DVGAVEFQGSVYTLADSGPGSLRDAIASSTPGCAIRFKPGLVGTIGLTSGELLINKDLRIEGPGPAMLAISGNNASRVFHVTPNVSVYISGLTIRDGAVLATGVDDNNNGNEASGGGILNEHSLEMFNCSVISNRAVGADGPLNVPAPSGQG